MKALAAILICLLFSFHSKGQIDSTIQQIDSSRLIRYVGLDGKTIYTITPEKRKKRVWLVASGNIVGYGAVMVGLYSAWYKDYPQTGFHTFDDWPEWKQMDKAGHFYSAYVESMGSMEMWRWTGIDRKKRIWLGGLSGAFYQTAIEVLDGFSAGWGWSWAL